MPVAKELALGIVLMMAGERVGQETCDEGRLCERIMPVTMRTVSAPAWAGSQAAG